MKELAEHIIAERRKRDLRLETVAERSGISLKMLRCFEAGDFECLGAPLLIRKTIREYCRVLEIDPDPLLEKVSSQIDNFNFQDRGIKKYAGQMKLLRRKRRMISPPLLLFAVATVAVMYGGAWISEKRASLYAPPGAERISTQEDLPAELRQRIASLPDNGTGPAHPRDLAGPGRPENLPSRTSRVDADLKEAEKAIMAADKAMIEAEKNIGDAERARGEVKADEPEQAWEASMEVARTETSTEEARQASIAVSNRSSHSSEVMAQDSHVDLPETPKRFRFAVEADAKTWVQVVIDEKETRSAMLHQGEAREWSALKGMRIVIGNAGGVHMKWDDQQVKAPRDPGRVLRFRLPEQLSSFNE